MAETVIIDAPEFPLEGTTGARYRIREDGWREYESGVLMRPDGTFAPGTARMEITQANASQLAERKWELAREAAQAGLMRAAEEHPNYNGRIPTDAWGFVVEQQAALAMMPEMGRDSTGAAKFVGEAADLLPRRGASGAESGITLHVSNDVAAELLRRLAERREEG